jgi:hypothetical protein
VKSCSVLAIVPSLSQLQCVFEDFADNSLKEWNAVVFLHDGHCFHQGRERFIPDNEFKGGPVSYFNYVEKQPTKHQAYESNWLSDRNIYILGGKY